jgi:hypothetical protein
MRQVTLGATGIATSCLGFGGSRMGEGAGLRALEAAFDAGVTWLDLAPLYHLARLDYDDADPEARASAVLENAEAAGQGVVDGRAHVFGTPGLFVVSTAVLPTSGQATPTLTAVQLGLRLADDMASGRV